MKKYSEDIINEIKLNNDIVDVVSDYVKLKKKGKDYFGLCPFHKEKTPSFSVAPNKGIFYCFGCQKGGSVVQFIMEIENLNYYEALDNLAKRANITVPEKVDPEAHKRREEKEKILTINKIAARFFYKNLQKNESALKYLSNRGIKNSTIKKYGLGYANDSWNDILNHLNEKGYSQEDILKAGLISKNQKGDVYDKFRKRIMFPIFDVYGSIIAFGGRVLDNSKPKYLNSPETTAYHKREHLYGLNVAKKTRKDYFILVEGYFDVVSMSNAGYDNCIASLGTALTLRQVRMLNRYDKRIFLGYDSDDAGQKATLKAINIFDKTGVEPNVIVMNDAKDLDEFINKKEKEEFDKLIDNALAPADYKITRVLRRYNTENTQEKIKALREIIAIIASLKDESLIDIYTTKYAKKLGISKESMLVDISRKKNNTGTDIYEQKFKGEDKKHFSKLKRLEIMLLLFYFNFDIGKDKIQKYFSKESFSGKSIENIYDLLFNKENDVTFSDILEKVSKENASLVISINEQIESIDEREKQKALDDFLYNIKRIKLEVERNEFKNININDGLNLSDKERLREFSEKLKKQKRKIEGE